MAHMSCRAWLTRSCGTRRFAMSVWLSIETTTWLRTGRGAGEGHAGADDPASSLSARFFIAIEHDPAVNRQSGRMGPNMADSQSKSTQTRPLCHFLFACGLESCSWCPRRCVLVVHLDLYGRLTHRTARQARHLAAGPACATATGPRCQAEPCRSYRMSQQKSHRRC